MSVTKLPFEKIERELFVKKKAETSPKFGIDPDKRPVDELINFGIVNINKPKGPTSHQVSAYVQKILKIKKSGHSGTLDPKVTGVLPVALGRGTRIVQVLLNAGKEYVCLMHVHKEIPEGKMRSTINEFVGKIKQKPPLRSSVKRQVRERKIYYIDILEIDGKDVLFIVGCQAGTYIRKLCHDIGEKLGVGAHMAELIRTKAGPFKEEDSVTLQDLADALWYYRNEKNEKFIRKCIQPIESAVTHLPKIFVFDTTVDTLCHGADLKVPGISLIESEIQPDENVAIMTLKGELVAVGIARMSPKDMLKKDKGVAAKTEKVFMLPGTYPRIQK
ncbi:RNA-guided pseudouridylation complex pseudouridine synthase subunit Cbf5 [Candidatus Woesearchaeota archaeon]|nr:RNA-guided pseudouridylation complex pseudouridine synthase subunit Cbf5 [Candidatus Woesearchaeota archaeon]